MVPSIPSACEQACGIRGRGRPERPTICRQIRSETQRPPGSIHPRSPSDSRARKNLSREKLPEIPAEEDSRISRGEMAFENDKRTPGPRRALDPRFPTRLAYAIPHPREQPPGQKTRREPRELVP